MKNCRAEESGAGTGLFRQSSIIDHRSSVAGFTLLELLISLSIVGLILIIVFGALRIGSRAWERGERDVETHQRQRIVLELMGQQLASASPQEIRVGEEKPFYFKGDERSVAFTSRVAVLPTNRFGTVFVQYQVGEAEGGEGESLSFYEKRALFSGAPKGMDEPEEEDFLLLIPYMESLRFEYLGPPEGEEEDAPQWQEAWDPETDKGLPLGVRVSLVEKANMPPMRILAPIAAETE
ncbi:MAG: prepilin-type N-terminal cleavage/methylation domain-containing protein [Deltaproteobacteria bacterium]|nr:prepilin-type N-terminal cleavage/methylation domain-containing protein [Deltaproteobacteria bacterium]MBW2112793.1 prepilin-type N-terminal cleavage/methylation domain-containing protein [Deltaproteobacteria bacterium]